MAYLRITAGEVEAMDHRSLISAWELYGENGPVKTFRCRATLTSEQLRGLPEALRARLGVQ